MEIYNGVLYYRVANKGLLKRFLYSILGLPTIREERPKDEISATQFRECYFNPQCDDEKWSKLVPKEIVPYLRENREYFIERYETLWPSKNVGDFKIPWPPSLTKKLEILYHIFFP